MLFYRLGGLLSRSPGVFESSQKSPLKLELTVALKLHPGDLKIGAGFEMILVDDAPFYNQLPVSCVGRLA